MIITEIGRGLGNSMYVYAAALALAKAKGVELKLDTSYLRGWPDAHKVVDKYKNNKTIKFVGFADPKEYYKQADVFVLPTIEEGSALVGYEAMASGLPLITTFNSGSIARDKKDGFIVPIRDIPKLKEKIKFMQDNPKKCAEMGKSARKYVEGFTWEKYGEDLVKEYEKIIAKKEKF